MADYIDWAGKSGSSYRYWFLASLSAEKIKAEAGNYIFAKRLPNGNYSPLYIGQAENLKARLPNHDRWGDAKRAGATHTRNQAESRRFLSKSAI